jgi:hypothetical protein
MSVLMKTPAKSAHGAKVSMPWVHVNPLTLLLLLLFAPSPPPPHRALLP